MRKGLKKKAGCDCQECKELCANEPGWFLPGEVDDAAFFLGMSKDEFIENFCDQHIYCDAIILSPKKKTGSKECIFLKKGLCSIHEVKPFECRKVYGCEEQRKHSRIREIIGKHWK